MKSRFKVSAAAIVIGLPLVVALAPAAGADRDREKQALIRTDTEFSDAAQKFGVGEAFARYADENATMLPAGQHAVRGLEAVRRQFAQFPKSATLVWKPYAAEVDSCGELGFTLGTYESHGPDAQGQNVTRYGKYCSVWKKQEDGRWKWVVDVGTPSPSPTR